MKNKKIIKNIVIIFFLSFINYKYCNPYKKTYNKLSNYQLLTCAKELNFEKKLSLSKLIIIPSITCYFLLYNKDSVIENIKKNPFFALISSCLLFSFIIDTTIKYKQINNTICLFELSKDMSRYILYAIAIKNTMIKLSRKDSNCIFCEEEFLKIITDKIPLSFNELEQLTSELLHNCLKTIYAMNIKIHTDLEEKIYLLCKEHVSIEDVLTIYNDDTECFNLLKIFLENPNESYKDVAFKLNSLIKDRFQYMINN